jgi:L-rhamnose mutarotase
MMRRVGLVLQIKPERIDDCKRYHSAVWPEILEAIGDVGITNYSIFIKDDMLFSYYEVVGPEEEYEQQMEKLSQSPRMRE